MLRYDGLGYYKLVAREKDVVVRTIWESDGYYHGQRTVTPIDYRVEYVSFHSSKLDLLEHCTRVGIFIYMRPSTLLPKRLTYAAHPH